MRERLGRAWLSLQRLEKGPAAAPVLVALALLQYGLVALAFPLAAGRDLGTYLRASFELRQAEVVLPQAMLGRVPVPGLFAEAVLSIGPAFAEVAMALLYALSIVCWWRVARRCGPAVAVVAPLLLLVYPGYALLFHRLSSDAVFAAGFAVAALLTVRLVDRPTWGRALALGAGVAVLVFTRPVAQLLVLMTPLVLLLPGPWKTRAGRLAALGAAAVVPLGAWAAHNAVRADDFTVVRGAGQAVPLYRAFVVEGIVRPENGDATRELARAVARDLLPREPYRSYRISVDEFFASRSSRMQEDLVGLADRTWGWDDDYAHLSRVGWEAVRAHPATFAGSVARDAWRLLWWPLFLPLPEPAPSATGWTGYAPVAEDQLPEPTEDQPIPSASVSAFISTPDGRFREVWTSPTEHHILADDPEDAAHLDRLNRRVDELFGEFSDRDGSATLARWIDRASRWFPRPIMWLVVGLALVAIRRPRGTGTPLVLAGAALLVLLGTALAVPAAAEYSAPVVPAFVLLAVAGLLAPRTMP
jgi:Dolichyl-phosphate-mannose-protein mannosyltransferase